MKKKKKIIKKFIIEKEKKKNYHFLSFIQLLSNFHGNIRSIHQKLSIPTGIAYTTSGAKE